MGKEVKERRSHTLASKSKPAMNFRTLLESGDFHDLLFLANKASAILFGEVVVVAPEESLTGRVEKHGSSDKLVVVKEEQAAQVEEAKHPSSGSRLEKRFGKKYVRRKNSKEHMDSTSTLVLVQSSQREKEIYNNAETHSKSEQLEAVDRQGRCSGVKNKSKGDDDQERRSERTQGKERACDPVVSDAADSETETEEDNEAENTISEAALDQAVLGSGVPGGEMIVSESEDFISLLDEAVEEEEEKEKGVSKASRFNQWLNFKTRPRTSRGIRRHVRWSNKKKRNCMAFEETQSNRKILILAVEAITHQLGLLDVSMEEKSSNK